VTFAGLPSDIDSVIARYRCCELSTISGDGTPVTWPAVPLPLPDRRQLLLTTSIGFPAKAANIRREPRVSLLYSDPTGSGLPDPPAVLVQGTARVDDEVRTCGADLEAHWRLVRSRQPASRWFSASAPARWFLDWYHMRLLIYVTPERVLWWPHRDTTVPPHRRDLADVA
jgi:Pyridoxamine 5'-phosphate oxidase